MMTIGEIAATLSCPVHRVVYAIDSRGIREEARLGGYRVYGPQQVEMIREALAEIASRRELGPQEDPT